MSRNAGSGLVIPFVYLVKGNVELKVELAVGHYYLERIVQEPLSAGTAANHQPMVYTATGAVSTDKEVVYLATAAAKTVKFDEMHPYGPIPFYVSQDTDLSAGKGYLYYKPGFDVATDNSVEGALYLRKNFGGQLSVQEAA